MSNINKSRKDKKIEKIEIDRTLGVFIVRPIVVDDHELLTSDVICAMKINEIIDKLNER